MQKEMAQLQKTTMKTLTRITKKKWLTKIKDFLHVHDLFHIEIGNKQHKKITRYSGNGVTMNSDGNVTSCSENFQAEIEEY
jgi:hypothetical protein